jgi:thiamine transporter ThiT
MDQGPLTGLLQMTQHLLHHSIQNLLDFILIDFFIGFDAH